MIRHIWTNIDGFQFLSVKTRIDKPTKSSYRIVDVNFDEFKLVTQNYNICLIKP